MRVSVRPILPTIEPGARVAVEPQHLTWQVGRYAEKLSSGPGGLGRAKVWVAEKEDTQHNTILESYFDSVIPNYGLIGGSRYAQVGSGTAEPNPNQTSLVQLVASSDVPAEERPVNVVYSIDTQRNGVRYRITRSAHFPDTAVGGKTLTEWGFGPTSSGGPLMTRELFRKAGGTPIELKLEPNHHLRLVYYYDIVVYRANTSQSVSVSVSGDLNQTHTATFGTSLYGLRPGTGTVNYAGYEISLGATGNGLLLAVEAMARGVNQLVPGYPETGIYGFVAGDFAPGTNFITKTAGPFDLVFNPASGRSRKAKFTFAPDANTTFKSAVISQGYSGNSIATTLYVLLSSNMTVAATHSLHVKDWTIRWG